MKTIITILVLSFSTTISAQFISNDDKLHLGAGALISGTTYAIVYSATKDKKKAFWYSLGTVTLAGLGKELIDAGQNERFDTGEMVSTIVGGLAVSTTISLFTRKKRKAKISSHNYTDRTYHH